MIHDHTGPIIPTEKRDEYGFAYLSETSYPGGLIDSSPVERGDEDEKKKYSSYEFSYHKHTDNAIMLKLRKFRKDIVQMRRKNGAGVIYEDYIIILSFGELMNRIFGPGCEVYLEEEAFPQAVKDLMRTVYDQNGSERK